MFHLLLFLFFHYIIIFLQDATEEAYHGLSKAKDKAALFLKLEIQQNTSELLKLAELLLINQIQVKKQLKAKQRYQEVLSLHRKEAR